MVKASPPKILLITIPEIIPARTAPTSTNVIFFIVITI